MSAERSKKRSWKDVQIAIASSAFVILLGMWNLFATPAKKDVVDVLQTPSPEPDEPSMVYTPTLMPYVNITFATKPAPQPLPTQGQQKNKKKNNNGGNGNNNGSVTQTKSS